MQGKAREGEGGRHTDGATRRKVTIPDKIITLHDGGVLINNIVGHMIIWFFLRR